MLDMSIDYLDYLLEKFDDDAYDSAAAIALMGLQAGDVFGKIESQQRRLEELFVNKNHEKMTPELVQGFLNGTITINEFIDKLGTLTDKEKEALEDVIKTLPSLNNELNELRTQAYEKLSAVIEKMNEELKEQRDLINSLGKVADHYGDIIDIVGQDVLGVSDELLKQLIDTRVTIAQGNLQISRTTKEALENDLEMLKKRRAAISDANSEDAKELDKKIKETTAQLQEATEQWASDWKEALQTITEARTKEIELASKAFEKSIAGSFGSLDYLQDAFDKEKELEDLYLKDFERVHDLNKLARDAQKAIDATDSIGGKMRLREIQEEILEKQKSGAKVSEYEVGVMERKLQLEQARIALEEAQNAKNMVRMTRDNEGNWSYTYTADNEKTADALQNFEDKLYDLEKFVSDRQEELQAQWPDYLRRMLDELGVAEEDRVEYVKTHYDTIMGIWQDFMKETMGDNE